MTSSGLRKSPKRVTGCLPDSPY